MPPSGSKFHVKVVRGRFAAMGPAINDDNYGVPYEEFFESDSLTVSPRLHELLDDSLANFVLVEDESAQASLSQLEWFVYPQDRITVIVHKAEQPIRIVCWEKGIRRVGIKWSNA
jgi:hypothetical protein